MSVAGRKMLRRKLDDNWRYGMPDDESIECAAKVFDIQSDAKSFVFGLENGTIEVRIQEGSKINTGCLTVPAPTLSGYIVVICRHCKISF